MAKGASLSLLLFLAVLHRASALDCPSGWEAFSSSCYKFVVRSLTVRGLNWENARALCLGYGGDLVSVANRSEMGFIYNISSRVSNEHYWIGLNDRRNESVFVWSDGTPYNGSVYSNWYYGEPNDRAGAEDCTTLFRYRWNDDNCKKEYSFICERPRGAPMPNITTVAPPVTPKPLSCPAGWTFYGSSCYKFSSTAKNWFDAKKDCRSFGGRLVKIDNGDEQHFITYRLSVSFRNMWIGLSDTGLEGTFIWEGDNSLVNYTHWGTGEPNDYGGTEDCVEVFHGSAAGFWNDDYCDSEKYYICEKPGGQNLCPVNWRTFGDSCYQFNVHRAQGATWDNAEKACTAFKGAELVSILSNDEQDYIVKTLKDLQITQTIWIGMNDRDSEGHFTWSDRSDAVYKNWAYHEPSRGGIMAGYKDCTTINVNRDWNGTWATTYCTWQKGYICKRKNGIDQCDSPLGMENRNIGDNQITASSSFNMSTHASLARLHLTVGNSTLGAWCAATSALGEFLQIDLGVVRQFKHIAVQGRPASSDFVKTFYLTYGDNGLDFSAYGQNATVKYKVLQGNSDAKSIRNVVLPVPIHARFVRIYPLTWSTSICLRTEIYGCGSQASSKKCGVGWEEGLDDTCYQINSNQRKLWADARATCISRGGDLLSIVSVKEKTWVNDRLKALSGWAYSFWLGLNDRDFDKRYYWSDGSPFKLTSWDAGFPKDTKNQKACVEIDAAQGVWRDVSCGEYRPFICKRKLAPLYGIKVPITGNWISGTDYYWPFDRVVDGKALGTVLATVMGNMTLSDRIQNGKAIFHFASSQAYLDVGQFTEQCITNPDQCDNGLTVSFVVQFEDGAKSWTANTFIVDSIGDKLLQDSRGFAVYVANNKLYAAVVTKRIKWTVSVALKTGVWQHVLLTWIRGSGLTLYIDGKNAASNTHGTVLTMMHTYDNPLFIVGSKSSQPTTGGFYMRSLAVWKRQMLAQEANEVYLAELGSCRTGWKDFGQFCYQFNLARKTWSYARGACVTQQGELVSIHSPVEQAHISLEAGPLGLDANAWIGLHDQGVESEFEWSDGTGVQYTYWNSSQPDNWINIEDCVNVLSAGGSRWNDQNCVDSLAYICKKRKEFISLGGNSPTTAPQKLIVCDSASAVLSCPTSTVVKITSANWGRTDASVCGQQSITNCRLDVTSNMKSKCDGSNHCSLKAANVFGSDPCVGISKYLEINYVCEQGRVITPGCPAGWQRTPDGSRCFGLLFDQKTWKQARDACKVYGADLASFHNDVENTLLTSLLVNSWDIGDVGGVWIGLTDTGQRGSYRWSDGSPRDYSSWLNGEPDERQLTGSCVRATLQPGKADLLFWVDTACSKALPYACAAFPINHKPTTSLPTTVPTEPCPSGWKLNGSSCYRMLLQNKTWVDARDACRALGQGSDLASIHSLGENAFVANFLNGSLFAAWLGLIDRGVLFGYVWSDNTPLQFTRWNPQQPDSLNGQQPCVEMYSTGDWGDTGCYSVKPFICKMPKPIKQPSTAPSTVSPTTGTQAPDICPSGWKLWNTMCYYFSNETQSNMLSWHNARRACQSVRGADLVSILSADENNFIKSRISGYNSWTFWMGLNDLGTESSYMWSDGSPLIFTSYGFGEPNDYKGQEDCMEITRSVDWNDNNCGNRRPYICKKTNNTIMPAFTMFPPSPGPALGRCKDGWVNYGKSCYLIVSDNLQTWYNARDMCRGMNTSMKGELVTVDDQYEQAFLTTMLLEKDTDFWIGLNDIHTEGTFFWSDSAPVKYTNWNVKEPQNYGWNRDCVDMSPYGDAGRWNNVQCYQLKGFVCEAGALPVPTSGPTSAAPSNRTCPDRYELLGDDCYFVSYVKLTWHEAREACRRESGEDLISVHDPFEQAFIVRNLKNVNGGMWLGFSRAANSAEFFWADHSLRIYTNWAPNQPDVPQTQGTCVVANNSLSNAGLWWDTSCSDRNGFVCRIRAGEPHVSPPLLGSCPDGWKKFDKSCYLFQETDRLPWTAARLSCQRRGGNLVSITSRQEQDFLIFEYRKKELMYLWTGLNDRALEKGYVWSDGSPVTFFNWQPNEPNDDTGSENCIEMGSRKGRWNDLPCSKALGYICKHALECSGALGMVSGNITNRQVTATSSMDSAHAPTMARLNSSSAWCANFSQPGQYIQIDLVTNTRLTKIATQGFDLNGSPSYIQSFKLQVLAGENGLTWKTYQKYGKDWVFIANRDATSIITLNIKPSLDTRSVRLIPVSWKNSICLRMELYGCRYACETPLGMTSGEIKDDFLSASSVSAQSHSASQARPSGMAWCPKTSDTQPWLQVTSPTTEWKITKITTWGGGQGSGFVTVYTLAYKGETLDRFTSYTEGGRMRNFRGNQNAVTPVTHVLAEPIITKFLRVRPLSWSTGGACLRLELFGCQNGCDSALGLRQGTIEDSALSASSSLDQAHSASEARLYGGTGWCAYDKDKKPFVVVDLGRLMRVRKAALQGTADGKGYVKTYTVSLKEDVDSPWKAFKQGDQPKVFTANSDTTSVVTNTFAFALRARFIKILPSGWNIRACFRLELYGCPATPNPTATPTPVSPSGSPKPPKDIVYTGSVKLTKQEWTDDYKNSNSNAFKTLKTKLEKSIASLYSGTNEASLAFEKVTVTGFRQGSVIALFNLTFYRDMAADLGVNVTTKLVVAVKSGKIGDIDVDPGSLNISQVEWNGGNGGQGTVAARTGDKSGGLSAGAIAGISLAVVVVLGACAVGLAWWYHKTKKGKLMFKHQEFDNPVYFSSTTNNVKTQ